jgi:hypothetical protein
MADRIIAMRSKLYNKLVALDTPGEWGHIKSQIGMFSYTGLKPEQVDALAEKAHVYLTRDGRISMAGLNDSNVEVSWGCCCFRVHRSAGFDDLFWGFPTKSWGLGLAAQETYRGHD